MRRGPADRHKIVRALRELHLVPRALRLVWSATGPLAALSWGLVLVQGLLPVGLVFLTKEVVDGLVAAIETGGGEAAMRELAATALALAFLYLLREALAAVAGWVRTVQADRIRDSLADRIQRQSTRMDLEFYESADFYDHLHRARSEAVHRPLSLVEGLASLVQGAITLLAMVGVLLPYGGLVPLVLLASTIPALLVVLRSTLEEHAWWYENTTEERRSRYLDWLLTAGHAAPEIRLFDLGDAFRRDYQELRGKLREEHAGIARRKALGQLLAAVFGLGLGAAAMAWMAWRATRGEVTLGDVALFVQAFHQGQGLLRELLTHLGQILANVLFLESLFEFLAMEPKIEAGAGDVAAPIAIGEGIRFEGVDFRYPGQQEAILDAFDLELEAGRVTAVVGENGAGKSTLIKLLCRLYDPEQGQITLDGVDLRELPLGELRRATTVLFQVPLRFHATVAENIAFGDLAGEPSMERIVEAAEAAGADLPVAHLPEGYETQLGKVYAEGADLSVGEWQRLALARAFLRQGDLLLLDEPTSAMDSWSASEWMRRFRELAQGRTALVITHRFTTAMRADVIHVLHEGKIVESGSHDELLARDGRYAEAWRRQRG